ncbi:MAG: nucleotide exchange factor GrpE [Actinomycetia bacterium]|nr:nucleotide exchange factor GrpE [Actinomycetes bacterium]
MTDPTVPDEPVEDSTSETAAEEPAAEPDLAALLVERTDDLQRLQAEYVNYKRRVDRDRDLARQRGIEAVLGDLLPVLDGIAAARSHDQLDAGAKLIADEIEKVTGKYGLVAYGEVGDPFDPQIHDALMHVDVPGYDVTTCAQVIQAGFKLHDRVLRPARVAVTDPSEPLAETEPAASGETETEATETDPALGPGTES